MASYQERLQAPPRRRRRIAAVMGLYIVSLTVASLLHLSGFAHGHARPFTATGAGIAEAAIATFALLLRTSKHRGGNSEAPEPASRAVRPGS